MKKLLFAFTIVSILSSCDPGSKKPSAYTIPLVGTWVLDSSYVRDTIAGVPNYVDSIEVPSTAPTITFSSNGIATSIDPAYTYASVYYPADTIIEDYYVSSDTLYTRLVSCGCSYLPESIYRIANNQLIQTLSNSFNPNLQVDFEMSYATLKY
ncbi:MAG TPA: hypothetical protein VK718_01985 [Ferruginibacter sp.]|jgi:hypothetical protein|nr:hypothetical protein [Ferruginibacter sp.]